jgi:hypothetical protein
LTDVEIVLLDTDTPTEDFYMKAKTKLKAGSSQLAKHAVSEGTKS